MRMMDVAASTAIETARAGHYGNDHFPWEKIVEI